MAHIRRPELRISRWGKAPHSDSSTERWPHTLDDMVNDQNNDGGRLGVFVDLKDRPVLVVGGGSVGERRVRQLLAVGAVVTLISPAVTEELAALSETARITWEARDYDSTDLPGNPRYWVVHTATGTMADAQVATDCDEAAIWCVRADRGAISAAVIGASAGGVDGIQVAVSSGDPGRSLDIANEIGRELALSELPLRRRRPERDMGWVALVGGGPGDVGLLTLRGRQLLALADVVVTDRLGPTEVLAELDDDVRVIDVGKSAGHHPVPQDEINQILVREALDGNRVVRLKGGDPFVLGRGAEEAQYCQENGVSVEWVPGVTSAVSVPAAAGIPVTHRSTSPAFVVASGHADSEAAAGTPPETTVLLLMGISHLPEMVELFVGRGRPESTPVAIVESGWTPEQRTTVTTLAECVAVSSARGVKPPAIIVVGPAAALADVLGPVQAVVPR